ncbi:unnamed protein product [Microthlaspi erraticum]|uniref:RBR-type E3 ubiquitin transferase n=1 Tax=Microthlaspi erraticum TaxID=1685480 RepID=A0A6D2K0G1_9BRAS|nr:unnamed protein product [Microthlaspi erraticum]
MSYSDEDDMLDYESGEGYSEDGDDLGYDDDGEDSSKLSQLGYVVLKEEDIRKHQRDDIEKVSMVFSVSQAEAIALLVHHHWSVGKIEDGWFTDEERVRKMVGILKEPVVDVLSDREVSVVDLLSGREVRIVECGVCFESYVKTEAETAAASCGHPYCNTCWTGYITAKVNDGAGCLMVKCPEPSCSAVVGQDMIYKFVSKEEDKEKYDRYLLRSYVEASEKRTKWCPSPGCEHAIFLKSESEKYDVSCLCTCEFCWNCSQDAHRPVDCETVSKWIRKNTDESENTNWILANTKPCPKCNRQIEKNQGCNHMTCSAPCRFEFCWLCLSPYNKHVGCNRFEGSASELKRERAKQAIDRYMHYFERWVSNQNARLRSMADFEQLQSVQLEQLSDIQRKPVTELKFMVDAWLQIIECRRVLKWTYAYGYYLHEQEPAKKDFFSYLQSEAETGLERLHHCAEFDLKPFLTGVEEEGPPKAFEQFKQKIMILTKVTKTYFDNLVKALENGLVDVEHDWTRDFVYSTKRQKFVLKGDW